jgi:hypothetical protein
VTDAKVIAPFAVLHACALALGVGLLIVLLHGTQEPRPDGSPVPRQRSEDSAEETVASARRAR